MTTISASALTDFAARQGETSLVAHATCFDIVAHGVGQSTSHNYTCADVMRSCCMTR